jgi:protein tyrosine/serine phosphatase
MDRHIDFEAIENFRDFGGYATACGRGLRRGRLYRSGHHALATDADLARLRDLGVAVIVDLRNPAERAREPGRRWTGFVGEVIENDIAPVVGDWVEVMKAGPMSADWWYENTRDHYRDHAFEPRHVDLFRRFLHAIVDSDGAVVVHCAAGKDRTGVACALAQHLAGVDHADIVADFLLTNDESRLARKMASARDFCERVAGRRPSDEALRVAVQVFPEFQDTTFAAIAERHGTVDAYLEDELGVDAALRARIHDRVLGAG